VQTGEQERSTRHAARNAALAFAILITLSLVVGLGAMAPKFPRSDAVRYITYALNLHDHAIFSLADVPGNDPPEASSTHSPLYPTWIAAFLTVDPALAGSLRCAVRDDRTAADCPHAFRSIVAGQLVLAGIFLGSVWLFARRLSGSDLFAWIATFCAILARNPWQYANQFLTEALLVPLLGLFILFLTLAYQDRRPVWMLATGAALGLAALTRPAYVYLFVAMIAVLAVAAAIGRARGLVLACLLFALAYGAVVAPWMMRNKALTDRFAVTTGYAGDILSQRVAYNRMTWPEWGAAFVYWLPDVGDSLAQNLFAKSTYHKLSWDEGSYYSTDAPALYRTYAKQVSSPNEIVPYILRTEILAQPVKHALVTLPLAFRAIFIAKYWGIAGLVCFIALAVHRVRRNDYTILLLSLPVWFMVVFHALVSVSIPRYNLALIPFYAYAMAWVFHTTGCRVLSILRQGKPGH
jgi:4-amino-4-deoxy-L-arabinose transferase-like glycosyltransferase